MLVFRVGMHGVCRLHVEMHAPDQEQVAPYGLWLTRQYGKQVNCGYHCHRHGGRLGTLEKPNQALLHSTQPVIILEVPAIKGIEAP